MKSTTRSLFVLATFCALLACSNDDGDKGNDNTSKSDAGADSAADDGNNGGPLITFGCFLDTCVAGKEYCPGAFCTGEEAQAEEPCPTGSSECLSGAGLRLCNSMPPVCQDLPDGCNSCDCVPEQAGCVCSQMGGADGPIRIECISP